MISIHGLRMIRLGVITICFGITAGASAAPLYEERFASPPGQFKAVHASTVLELPDTALLACWYAGQSEMGSDVQVVCSRLAPGSKTWNSPQIVVRKNETPKHQFKNYSIGNPVIHLDREGGLWLFYGASSVIKGWAFAHVDYKFSADLGATWSEARRFSGFMTMVRNKTFPLDQEHFLLPMYREFPWRQGFICNLRVKSGKILGKSCFNIPGTRHIQPALARDPSGILRAYLRTRQNKQVLVSEILPGFMKARKPVKTDVFNPDSAVEVLETEFGTLMSGNNIPQGRHLLSLLISKDGLSFKPIFEVAHDVKMDFAYPTMIRSSDGLFHLLYTYDGRKAISHVTFNAEWLKAKVESAK